MSAQVNLQIRDVSKVFRTDDDRMVEALSPVTIELHEGELVCLVGPTGCGKTTLLRMVAGLELKKTIFRSDHASNYLPLKGVLNADKDRLLATLHSAIHDPGSVPLREEWQRGL